MPRTLATIIDLELDLEAALKLGLTGVAGELADELNNARLLRLIELDGS